MVADRAERAGARRAGHRDGTGGRFRAGGEESGVRGQVRVAEQTRVQEIVLTRSARGTLDLFLDGRLRVDGADERQYHRALVDPAMRGPHRNVLILGGGDGLAAREVLSHRGVASVTLVELDPGVERLARTDPGLSALNGHVYRDPRLRVVTADAFNWLRSPRPRYDVVVSDLPDPGITASTKLYSEEFYGLVSRALAPGGRLAVHAGPVDTRPGSFWTVDATVRAAGLRAVPYRASGRGAGFAGGPDRANGAAKGPSDWGFVLAARSGPALGPAGAGPWSLATGRPSGVAPSTLVHPRYGG